MEFETNTPPSDDARMLAEAKQVTVQPLHTDIAPEDVPDSVVVANHLRAGALANASNDIEQNAPPITAAAPVTTVDPAHHSLHVYILTATGIAVLIGVILVVIFS